MSKETVVISFKYVTAQDATILLKFKRKEKSHIHCTLTYAHMHMYLAFTSSTKYTLFMEFQGNGKEKKGKM